MAKARLERIFGAFGRSSTRLLIIDAISKNGNSINKEDLIDKIMGERNVKRPAVRRHLRKMEAERAILQDGKGNLSLKDPVEVIQLKHPLETWAVVGIPLGVSLFFISFLQGDLLATVVSMLFSVFSFAIEIRDILNYLRKVHNRNDVLREP